MDDLGNLQLDQLTTEMAWIRRLALALVKDASTADDIAQDVWLAAAGRVPSDRPLRPWLSRVVLNLVRMRGRTATRREAREARVAEPAPVPTAEELVDRDEIQRLVAGEVLALAEPYRSMVLLHYFEGLTSAEIARRHDLPEGTVRRRLKVALDELRARLGTREHRRGRIAVFGGITMKKFLAGFVLLALLLGGFWLWRRHAAEAGAGDAASTAPSSATPGLTRDPIEVMTGTGAQLPWLVQRGVVARKIAGRVLYRGEPLPGATVRLGNVTNEGGRNTTTGDELATVTSGADGRFDFGAQPAAIFHVSAEAEGKAPAMLAIATADPTVKSDQLVLELGACRSRLFGTVVDSSGGGVAKARLRVAGLGGTDASATGAFSLCVPMGDSIVHVEGDGYGAIEVPIHLVGELRHDFELVPEAVLVGSVVDEHGRGVAFARVIAVPQAVEEPHNLGAGAARADAEGKFRIANLAPGRFMLVAAADGYGSAASKPAIAELGTATHELVLVVARRARIAGRVVMGGAPVAGARIAVGGPGLLARGGYSQPDGSFVLEGVPFGNVKLAAAPYELVAPKPLVIDKPQLDGVTLEVTELATMRGRVLRHGKPVTDANVQSTAGLAVRSDATGAYELKGLQPGTIQVTAQAFGATAAFSPLTPVTVTAGKVTDHDIDLTGGAEVHGVVVDESGTRLPNVYVRLIDGRGDLGESMTDARGGFECTSMLGGGAYRVSVFPSPGSRIAFAPAGDALEIDLANGDTIRRDVRVAIKHDVLAITGRVIDDKGQPVADVHIEAIGVGNGGRGVAGMLPSVRGDASGQFSLGNLARGAYTLHAHAGDGSEAELANIAAGATNVELRLVRPGTIEGTLVGFASTPRVHARQMTAQLLLGNEAIVEGDRFSITGLTPGKYALEALAGEENAGLSVEVKSGVTARVKLESRGRGSVEGSVLEFGTRAPVTNMNCWAVQSVGGQAGDLATQTPASAANATDAKGAFKIPAPVGKARVVCFPIDNTFSVAGGDVEVGVTTPGRLEMFAVRAVPPPSDPGFRIKSFTLPLVIAAVDPAGPAAPAGLKVGDRVVSIDGAPVTGLIPSGAMMLAVNKRPGSTLALGIDRAGAPMTFKIVVVKATN